MVGGWIGSPSFRAMLQKGSRYSFVDVRTYCFVIAALGAADAPLPAILLLPSEATVPPAGIAATPLVLL